MRTAYACMFACAAAYALGGEVVRDARIFKIDALVTPPVSSAVPAGLLAQRAPRVRPADADDDDYHGGGRVMLWDNAVGRMSRRHATVLEPGEVVALIRMFVAEDTWANERNSLRIDGGKLTVVQTPEVLAEVEKFLEALHHRCARRHDVACAVVPPAALDAALRAAGASRDAAWYPPGVLDDALAAAGDAGWSWRATVKEGEAAAIAPVSQRLSVRDYDVNQTGTAPLVNPLVGLLRDGPGLLLQVAATPLADRLFLDLVFFNELTGRPGALRRIPMGDIELAAAGGTSVKSTLLIPPGQTALAAELSWPLGEVPGYALLARVTPVPRPRPPQSPATVIEVGMYVDLVSARRTSADEVPAGDGNGPFTSEAGEDENTPRPEVIGMVRRWLPRDLANDPRLRLQSAGGGVFLAVLGDAAAGARAARLVASALEERFRAKARSVKALAIRGSIPKDACEALREGGGALLVPDWREKAALARETRVRLAGLGGRDLSMFAGMGRTYIGDIETVSGGTKYAVLEVPDPCIRWAGTGIDLAMTAQPVAGTPWMQVSLRGEVFATAFGRTSAMRVDHTVRPGGPLGFEALGQTLDIELPDQQVNDFRHVVTVPAGRTAFLNAMPDPDDPARVIMLAVEARVLD